MNIPHPVSHLANNKAEIQEMSPLYEIHNANIHIVKRHYIFLLYHFLRNGFFLAIAGSLYAIAAASHDILSVEIRIWGLLPVIFLIVNYSFLSLILGFIEYYNSLVVLVDKKLYIISSSLLLKDDIEIMDLSKVTKVDLLHHGFWSNVLGYGDHARTTTRRSSSHQLCS